ncbi:phosphotransferase [Planomonospora sphaerica]|uniref:phosphotransferase n=1 Tax=Planomonospora sphaerica TaxID=161355 RepID=UPI0009FE863A|nr:phosphotransferase [Planomonospora sphaerica]
MEDDEDEPLVGGRMTQGVVRRREQVLRPLGPWSGAVHEYLRHLESVGFPGAPRVLGIEGDREVLTYLDGEVPADPAWQPGRGHRLPVHARSDDALIGAGRLIRDLHEASRGFRPRCTAYRFHPCPARPGQIISHGDLGPWNTVYRNDLPVAFIDFDSAGPVDPVDELAAAAWAFVPLEPDRRLREAGFDPVPDLPDRLRMFVDAYGLPDRPAILPALQRSILAHAERIATWPLSPADAAGSLEYMANELRWLHTMTPALERALSG